MVILSIGCAGVVSTGLVRKPNPTTGITSDIRVQSPNLLRAPGLSGGSIGTSPRSRPGTSAFRIMIVRLCIIVTRGKPEIFPLTGYLQRWNSRVIFEFWMANLISITWDPSSSVRCAGPCNPRPQVH